MTSIVIAKIQNRRGLRRDLPQPLLPGEFGQCLDTGQLYIGTDPDDANNYFNSPVVSVFSQYINSNGTTSGPTLASSITDANNMISQQIMEMTLTDPTVTGADVVTEQEAATGATVVTSKVNLDTVGAIVVDDGGIGYTTATVLITGDGVDAAATANLTGNVVTSITIDDPGSGYTEATAVITGDGSGALLTVVLDARMYVGYSSDQSGSTPTSAYGTLAFLSTVDAGNTFNVDGDMVMNDALYTVKDAQAVSDLINQSYLAGSSTYGLTNVKQNMEVLTAASVVAGGGGGPGLTNDVILDALAAGTVSENLSWTALTALTYDFSESDTFVLEYGLVDSATPSNYTRTGRFQIVSDNINAVLSDDFIAQGTSSGTIDVAFRATVSSGEVIVEYITNAGIPSLTLKTNARRWKTF